MTPLFERTYVQLMKGADDDDHYWSRDLRRYLRRLKKENPAAFRNYFAFTVQTQLGLYWLPA